MHHVNYCFIFEFSFPFVRDYSAGEKGEEKLIAIRVWCHHSHRRGIHENE